MIQTDKQNIDAYISVPTVNPLASVQGPRGIGIKDISQNDSIITVTLDNDKEHTFSFPDWWFGTRAQYNKLTDEEKSGSYLHFIQEDS